MNGFAAVHQIIFGSSSTYPSKYGFLYPFLCFLIRFVWSLESLWSVCLLGLIARHFPIFFFSCSYSFIISLSYMLLDESFCYELEIESFGCSVLILFQIILCGTFYFKTFPSCRFAVDWYLLEYLNIIMVILTYQPFKQVFIEQYRKLKRYYFAILLNGSLL